MADRQFASRMARVVIASARPVTMAIVYFALALFFPFVASFQIVAIAGARPVTMEVFYFALACCFTSLRIFTGGRPMAAPTACIFLRLCHLENGNIPNSSAGHNRAVAIAHMPFSTRIGRLPRPSIARPRAWRTANSLWECCASLLRQPDR